MIIEVSEDGYTIVWERGGEKKTASIVQLIDVFEVEPFKDFAEWVASEVCTEGFEDKWSLGAFAEVACRKLWSLGVVQKFKDEWVYVDKDELDSVENG